ncbi:hypothetical protein [uncultured Parabacteroides sp.]|nr:hypothetical protein [uncultured Parabacteroides sp.]
MSRMMAIALSRQGASVRPSFSASSLQPSPCGWSVKMLSGSERLSFK